ncbi:MAG: type II toxin-antitoxin system HicB family antitoxin [Pseudomonadota bacterium]
MKRKHQKTLELIFKRPVSGNIQWGDIESLFLELGAEIYERAGSRIAVVLMTLDGYKAKIEYDPELDMFRGEILNLNGGADFYGKNPDELREEFKNSLAVFL